MSLKLTVYAPVDPEDPEGDLQDYVYDGVTLLKQFPTFVSEYEQGKVVQPNAQLRVKEGLFGVDSWFDLPEGDWRAKVEYGAAVLINGRLRRKDIEWDEAVSHYVVRVVDDATDKAKADLKAVSLVDLPPAVYAGLSYRSILGLVPRTAEVSESLTYLSKIGFIRAYNVLELVQAVFEAAGLGGAPTALYDYTVAFNDNGDDWTVSRPVDPDLYMFSLQGFTGAIHDNPPGSALGGGVLVGVGTYLINPSDYNANSLTLPLWDGWKLVESVCRLAGWTFFASYGTYPSEAITVTLIPDAPPEAAGQPAIDALWDKGFYTLGRADAWKPSLALRLDAALDLPDLRTAGDAMANVSSDASREMDQIYTPPPYAYLAADRWLFDRDGKPLEADEVSVPFTLPAIAQYGDEAWYEEAGQLVPDGLGNHLTENRVYGYPLLQGIDDEACYLASIRDTVDGERAALLWRRAVNAASGSFPVYNESWAGPAFANYYASRADRDTLKGTILAATETVPFHFLVPGIPAQGVTFNGLPWLVERVERKTETEALAIEASRLAWEPFRETDVPFTAGAVRGLTGKYEDIEGLANEIEYVHVMWDWPSGHGARALQFDVQRWDFGTSAWVDVATVFGRHVIDEDRSEGTDVEGNRHAKYRVRAVFPEALGEPDTEGPWTEVLIYF